MSFLAFPQADREARRLRALADYRLMDTPPEPEFDRLVSLAARLFGVPTVLISLVGADRQFFKAKVGLDVCETSREVSFCSHAIAHDDILLVPNALKDIRFSTNPLVLGAPFIRFYAGMPLTVGTGERIGTVCLIDSRPRSDFTPHDRQNLSDLAALVVDRIEMRRLESVRTVSQARFENIAATSPDAIVCSDAQGVITFWNRSAERLFGYAASEVTDRPGEIVIPASWRRIYEAELARLRRGEAMELADRTIELSGLRKDGSEFPAEFSLSTWDEGNTASVGAIIRDVTERRENEERLFRLACMDALTDLPNRAAWRERLTDTLAAGKPASVLLLDLDGFKEVNDTLGHSAGDAVLRETARRLETVCHEADMIARLGGDEFVALLPTNDLRTAQVIADRLIDVLAAPHSFAGEHIAVGVTIGIATAPDHGTAPEHLLNAADLALYRAKGLGKGRWEVFTPALREVSVARRAFEHELRAAFAKGEFELFTNLKLPQAMAGSSAPRRCYDGTTPLEACLRPRHSSIFSGARRQRSTSANGHYALPARRPQSGVNRFRVFGSG